MKVFGKVLAVGVLAIFIAGIALTANQFAPGKASRVPDAMGDQAFEQATAPLKSSTGARENYNCELKVFMVEQEGRWFDDDGHPFANNFLSFAFDTTLSLAYLETYQETKIWSAGSWSHPTHITQNNMMAIAALYDSEVSGQGDSDPYPPVAEYDIHTVDACASATHGNPGSDVAIGNSTHTVFVEDASTTW